MTDFTLKECKEKGGISVKPIKNIKLNLKKVADAFETLIDTPILVVIQEQGEVIVRDYGELLFKELKDETKIREIAIKIYGVAL